MKLILTVLLSYGVNMVYGQVELISLNAISQRENINLTWELAKGSNCNGTIIQRSGDGINFVDIGEIQGICGSPDVAQSFSFLDENPIPFSLNYYRLLFGSSGYSPVVNADFAYVPDYFALENPFTDKSILYLSSVVDITLKFIDSSGKFHGIVKGGNKSFLIGELFPDLPNGIIILEVSNDNGNYFRKKFLKTE